VGSRSALGIEAGAGAVPGSARRVRGLCSRRDAAVGIDATACLPREGSWVPVPPLGLPCPDPGGCAPFAPEAGQPAPEAAWPGRGVSRRGARQSEGEGQSPSGENGSQRFLPHFNLPPSADPCEGRHGPADRGRETSPKAFVKRWSGGLRGPARAAAGPRCARLQVKCRGRLDRRYRGKCRRGAQAIQDSGATGAGRGGPMWPPCLRKAYPPRAAT
jgi:hypothetical protein